jgi:polyisoprenoid-binding protein YceI
VPAYTVDTARSHLVVRARSSIHDTDTRWDRIAGTVEADPDRLETDGARATFSVDMASFDAGDWLKNRKLKKDLDLAAHPTATFELSGLRDVSRKDDGSFSAVADGVLRWRGREVALSVAGSGTMDAAGIDATGSFDLDIRDLGMQAPRFLMFKVSEEVSVQVTLRATAR